MSKSPLDQLRDVALLAKSHVAAYTKADGTFVKEHEDGHHGFLQGRSALHQGKIKTDLSKQMRLDGKVDSIKGHVERMHHSGDLELSSYDEPKIKDMSKRQHFNATNEQQEAHREKQKSAGMQTVHLTGGWALGKTAHEYAQHLKSKAPAPAAEPETAKLSPEEPAEKPLPKSLWTDDQWKQLHIPEDNANHATHKRQLDQMRGHAEAGDVDSLKKMKFGVNTYGKKRAKIHAALLETMGEKPLAKSFIFVRIRQKV
jgi:hypothetical protein